MSDKKFDEITLFLNEENEISLQLSIEGTSTSELSKPDIRFVLEDKNQKGVSLLFPTIMNEDKTVNVLIPGNDKILSESNQYKGKLEVIIGNRYFCPKELDIKFQKPVKVESKLVVPSISQQQATTPIVVSSSPTTEKPKPQQSSPVLTEDQKKAILKKKKELIEKKIQEQRLAAQKKQAEPPTNKSQLKNMLKSALNNWDE